MARKQPGRGSLIPIHPIPSSKTPQWLRHPVLRSSCMWRSIRSDLAPSNRISNDAIVLRRVEKKVLFSSRKRKETRRRNLHFLLFILGIFFLSKRLDGWGERGPALRAQQHGRGTIIKQVNWCDKSGATVNLAASVYKRQNKKLQRNFDYFSPSKKKKKKKKAVKMKRRTELGQHQPWKMTR